jgi:mannosyltransferase OCH1-like enzyme
MQNQNNQEKIPRTLHFCWFGKGEKSETIKKCMESWKKFCPDYKIMEWNEETFDINKAPVYVQEAYGSRKWAFISDYVRLWALDKFGGVYVDADIEIVKPIERFLLHEGFSGFTEVKEKDFEIPAAMMGAKKGNEYVKFLLSYYSDRHFLKDGKPDLTQANIYIITSMTLSKYPSFKLDNSLQEIPEFVYYPYEFFTPKFNHHHHVPIITNNTYCIHYHNESWMSPSEKKRIKVISLLSIIGLKKPLSAVYHLIKGKNKDTPAYVKELEMKQK